MVIAWILFRNILIDVEIQEWATTAVLILGYVVSLVNVYMVLYFFKMFIFFYKLITIEGSRTAKAFFTFTICLSFMMLLSIFHLCIVIPTLNYYIPIEKQVAEMPNVMLLRRILDYFPVITPFFQGIYLVIIFRVFAEESYEEYFGDGDDPTRRKSLLEFGNTKEKLVPANDIYGGSKYLMENTNNIKNLEKSTTISTSLNPEDGAEAEPEQNRSSPTFSN